AVADGVGVWLWDVSNKMNTTRLPTALRAPEATIRNNVTALAFSPRGDALLVAVTEEGQSSTLGEVIIYDVAERKPLYARTVWGSPVRAAFSPDGRAIAVAIPSCATILYCRD